MRLTYQHAENALRLTLDEGSSTGERRMSLTGYVDMGTGGRIVGLEALEPEAMNLESALRSWTADQTAAEYVSVSGDSAYIELSAPEETDIREQIRAVPATFSAEIDSGGQIVAISIPRHGAGYEISYPSGNQ